MCCNPRCCVVKQMERAMNGKHGAASSLTRSLKRACRGGRKAFATWNDLSVMPMYLPIQWCILEINNVGWLFAFVLPSRRVKPAKSERSESGEHRNACWTLFLPAFQWASREEICCLAWLIDSPAKCRHHPESKPRFDPLKSISPRIITEARQNPSKLIKSLHHDCGWGFFLVCHSNYTVHETRRRGNMKKSRRRWGFRWVLEGNVR